MQFRLRHLILLTTWVAVFFALRRLNAGVALLLLPATFGPIGGYLAGRCVETVVVGFLSGYFFCLLGMCCGGIFLSILANTVGAGNLGSPGAGAFYVFWIVYLITCSLIGGYVCARAVVR